MYPIARGSAPLVAIAVGIGMLGERLAPGAALGVACLIVGILAVARPWRALRAAGAEHRGAIGFALATGATIAAYSTVDRLGVRILQPWLYGTILAVFATTTLWVSVTVGRRVGILAQRSANGYGHVAPAGSGLRWRDGAAGVLSLAAYLLILTAYSIAPLAAVAPLRESGIVIAAAWGALRLGESNGRREAASRIVAAAFVVTGAVLLGVSR